MRLLILCGMLFPAESNNSKLLSKLLPYLQQGNELQIAAMFKPGKKPVELPKTYQDIPVHWVDPHPEQGLRGKLVSMYSRLMDKGGYSDLLSVSQYRKLMKFIYSKWQFSAVLSVSEPFSAAAAGTLYSGKARTAVYFMDPPPSVRGIADTPFRTRCFRKIIKQTDAIVSTPFFRDALKENGFGAFSGKTVSVSFPMVMAQSLKAPIRKPTDRISLLFTGWMCSDIRSPKYFLEIVSRLDERFEVTFMGKECQLLQKRFPTETRASLITLPQQPYETALQAMADADILINIGNSVPVHMPSKTLEYINTGKPIVNFYKLDDCPTLYYTKRYPLCLNLSEKDGDLDAAAKRFTDFCIEKRGKTVERQFIEREYADCTPEYIADRILQALESN